MLTTSLEPAARARAEAFGTVRGFVDKPLTLEDVRAIAAMLATREAA